MRVITGKYKGRHFQVPRTFKARPTTDFAKENIFNVLRSYVDFEGLRAVDLFAGTGSITLELLSRGCSEVLSVELDRQHAAFIRSVLQKLEERNARLMVGDALRVIQRGSAHPSGRHRPFYTEGGAEVIQHCLTPHGKRRVRHLEEHFPVLQLDDEIGGVHSAGGWAAASFLRL